MTNFEKRLHKQGINKPGFISLIAGVVLFTVVGTGVVHAVGVCNNHHYFNIDWLFHHDVPRISHDDHNHDDHNHSYIIDDTNKVRKVTIDDLYDAGELDRYVDPNKHIDHDGHNH